MKVEWPSNAPLLVIGFGLTSILSVASYEYRPRRSYSSKAINVEAEEHPHFSSSRERSVGSIGSVGDTKGTATDKKFLDEVQKMKKINRPPVFNFHNLNSTNSRQQQLQTQQQQQQSQSQHVPLRKEDTTERGTVVESVLTTPNHGTKTSYSSTNGVKSKSVSNTKPKLKTKVKPVAGVKSKQYKYKQPVTKTQSSTNTNTNADAEEEDDDENESDTTPSARITSTTTGDSTSTSTSSSSTSASAPRKQKAPAANRDADDNEYAASTTTAEPTEEQDTDSESESEPESESEADSEPEPKSETSSKTAVKVNDKKLGELVKYINDQIKEDTVPETEKIEELQKLVKDIKENPGAHRVSKTQMQELQHALDKVREQVQAEVQKLSKALDNIDDNVDDIKNVSPESNNADTPSFKELKKVIHEIQTSVRDLDPNQIDRLEEHVEELVQLVLRTGSLTGSAPGSGTETETVPISAELLVEVYGVVDDVKEKLREVESASDAVNRLEDKVSLIRSQDQIISEILSQKVVKLQQLMDELDYKVRVDENPSEETIDALDNLLGEMKNYHLEVPPRQLCDLKFIVDTAKQFINKNGGSTLMLDKIEEEIKGEVTVYNAFQEVSRPKIDELKKVLETIKNNKNNTAGEVDLMVLEEAVSDIVEGIKKEPLESEISRSDVIKLEGIVEDLQAKLQKRQEILILHRIQKKVEIIKKEAPKAVESRPELLAQLQALIEYIDTRLKLEALPRSSKIAELEKVIEKIKFSAQGIPFEQMNETERVIVNLVELTEAEGVATTKVDQILDDLEVVNSTSPEEYFMTGGKLTEVDKLKEVMHDALANLAKNQTEEIPIENLAEAIEYVVDEIKEKLDMVQLPPFEMEMLENVLWEIREKSLDPEVLDILDLLEERVDEIKQPELELPQVVVAEGNLTKKLQTLVDKYRNTSTVHNEEVNKVGALMQELKKKSTDKGIVSREYVAALEKLIINLHKQRKEAKLRDMLLIFTEIHIQNLDHPETPLRKKVTARHLSRFQRRKRRLKKEHVVGVLKKSKSKSRKKKSKVKARRIVKTSQRSMRLSKKSKASRHKRWSVNERYYADYR